MAGEGDSEDVGLSELLGTEVVRTKVVWVRGLEPTLPANSIAGRHDLDPKTVKHWIILLGPKPTCTVQVLKLI